MSNSTRQAGFLEAPAFVLLTLLSLCLGVQALIWQVRLKEARGHHQQTLCLKEAILETSQLVHQIGAINQMLFTGQVGRGISLLFPGTGWLLAAKWEKVKRVLQGLQEARWLKTQFLFQKMRLQGCHLPWQVLQTPYRHTLQLVREGDLTTLVSLSQTWRWRTPLYTYQARWQLKSPRENHLRWSHL